MYFGNFLRFSESRLHPKGKRLRLPPYGLDTSRKVERDRSKFLEPMGFQAGKENTGQRKKADGLLLRDWAQHQTKTPPVLGRLSIPYFLGIIFFPCNKLIITDPISQQLRIICVPFPRENQSSIPGRIP